LLVSGSWLVLMALTHLLFIDGVVARPMGQVMALAHGSCSWLWPHLFFIDGVVARLMDNGSGSWLMLMARAPSVLYRRRRCSSLLGILDLGISQPRNLSASAFSRPWHLSVNCCRRSAAAIFALSVKSCWRSAAAIFCFCWCSVIPIITAPPLKLHLNHSPIYTSSLVLECLCL